MAIRIVSNLKSDFEEFMRSKLRELGVKRLSVNEDPIFAYVVQSTKLIASQPRIVYRSDELANCPQSLLPDLEQILLKAERGEDLSGYLSKQAKKREPNDLLLSAWRIHHLHLVHKTDARRAHGSGHLLLCRITYDALYAIAVTEHRNWTDPLWVQILRRNWPSTVHAVSQGQRTPVEQAELNELNREHHRSMQEEQRLREARINGLFIDSDGALYMPSVGMSAAGYPIEDSLVANRFHRQLHVLEQIVENELPGLITKHTNQNNGIVHLKLIGMDLLGFSYADFMVESSTAIRLRWDANASLLRMEIFDSVRA